MDFMGIGMMELMVIIVVAIIVLGPAKTIDMAKNAGKVVREMKRSVADISARLDEERSATGSEWRSTEKNPDRDSESKTPQ